LLCSSKTCQHQGYFAKRRDFMIPSKRDSVLHLKTIGLCNVTDRRRGKKRQRAKAQEGRKRKGKKEGRDSI
jgi:hypothetical protein